VDDQSPLLDFQVADLSRFALTLAAMVALALRCYQVLETRSDRAVKASRTPFTHLRTGAQEVDRVDAEVSAGRLWPSSDFPVEGGREAIDSVGQEALRGAA
jgi:hypothetical protein